MPKVKLTDPFIRNFPPPEKREEVYDKHVQGLAVRITPTGHKSFVYRYRYNNKVRRYTIGSYTKISLADARDEARELAYKISKGTDPLEEKKKNKHKPDLRTFKELAEIFREKYIPSLRENTQREYERIIDKELLPVLGEYPVEEISKNQVINLLDKKAFQGDAPTMANKIRARLSRIFTFGMERGLAESNPVQSTTTYKKGRNKRDRYYSKVEIRELWKFFEQMKEPTQSVFKMLLITGQRKTETMHMRWDRIQDDVWTIPAELAKNKEPHDVPLSPMAQGIINKMKPISGDTDYVFCSPQKENEPLAWLTRARKYIQDNSKVSDFRPQDLRRTVATYMAKLRVDRTVLGKILNHKGLAGDSQVTAIYDRHSYLEEKREAMDLWAEHLEEILTEERVKV